jgi:hypothetical protein
MPLSTSALDGVGGATPRPLYPGKEIPLVMSRDQNAEQNGYIQTGNESFETVERFKYLGTTLTNQNSIHAEIKSRLE